MAHHVFGIRHHGPGSARALVSALTALAPDLLLVEGPPDADELVAMAGDAHIVPPVAILVHAADDPGKAVFYPFADYSPEWQALRYALNQGIPARFFDLPQAVRLAAESDQDPRPAAREDPL